MGKYKVYYSGVSYVEADSPEEAASCYEYDALYEEWTVDGVEEVDEFEVEF